jgi:hypothetical protein
MEPRGSPRGRRAVGVIAHFPREGAVSELGGRGPLGLVSNRTTQVRCWPSHHLDSPESRAPNARLAQRAAHRRTLRVASDAVAAGVTAAAGRLCMERGERD